MRWSCEEVAGALVVRVMGERRRGDVGWVIGSLVLAFAVACVVSGLWLRAGVLVLAGGYGLYSTCRAQFGVVELRVDADGVTLSQGLFGLQSSTHFPRADVEKFGYIPVAQHQEPALAMMISTLMWPKRVVHGMEPEDADRLLIAVASSDSWIAPKTLRVGTPLF